MSVLSTYSGQRESLQREREREVFERIKHDDSATEVQANIARQDARVILATKNLGFGPCGLRDCVKKKGMRARG